MSQFVSFLNTANLFKSQVLRWLVSVAAAVPVDGDGPTYPEEREDPAWVQPAHQLRYGAGPRPGQTLESNNQVTDHKKQKDLSIKKINFAIASTI